MAGFAVNDKIGRYIIKERLGRGGMAEVYRAYDANLDRDVAIKVMYAYLSDDQTFKERFEREAKFVAGFNHPNIVRIYDFDSIQIADDTIYYMVMPYLPGKTLRDLLKEYAEIGRRLTFQQVFEIARDVGGALGYAHDRGMIHRDVKPANVMFDENGRVVLMDFGIARLVEGSNLTQDGLTVGTPAYMSPEQAAGEPVDARSDLYAFGVILYELLTGHPPFDDDGSISVILKHLNEAPPSLSKYLRDQSLPEVDAIIQRLLAKETADRYQSAAEAVADLTRTLGSQSLASGEVILESQEWRKPDITRGGTPQRVTSATRSALPTTTQLTQQIQAAVKSPVGILIIGAAILSLFVLLGMLNRSAEQTPRPTPTVPVTPASAASMTDPLFFVSTFAASDRANQYWTVEQTDLLTREITDDGFYRLVNNRQGTAITSIAAPGYVYDNITVFLKGRLEEGSSEAAGYGLVFRYIDDNNYNVFAVDGLGRFSIWARIDGEWIELRDAGENWTQNDAVAPLGEFNSLMLDNFRNTFTGFINGVEVVSVTFEDSPASGAVGIYLASTQSGTASALIDSFSVVKLTPSMTE
ncbi:MAG TPA: protein kinase [Aggregatilineales bacterium]|nr:protein kinase [Aggregatilineales bacterium]